MTGPPDGPPPHPARAPFAVALSFAATSWRACTSSMRGGRTSSTLPTRSCTAASGSTTRSGRGTTSSSDDRVYVPFAPFPALAVLPLVALFGPARLDQWEQVVDSAIAAIDVGLCWWLMGRVGVRIVVDRFWLVFSFGFSTQILWVTTRGGVWHTGHLIAAMVTLGALIETFGRRRGWLLGLLVGAGFLTRAPLALAVPFFAWVIADDCHARWPDPRSWPWRRWLFYGIGIAPAVLFFALVQRSSVRIAARIRLRPRVAAAVPRGPAGGWACSRWLTSA